MRKKTGFANDKIANLGEVADCGFMAQAVQCVGANPIAKLRLLAQGEQRLCATRSRAGASDTKDFFRLEKWVFARARRMRKSTILTYISA